MTKEDYSMKKYLFFDVDGTLYNHEKRIPASTKEAIQLAKQNGHEIAIATGRAPFMIRELLEELEINTYICFNGQYVVLNGELIFTDGVEKSRLKDVLQYGEMRGEPLVFLDDKRMIATHPSHAHVEQSLATLKYPYPSVLREFYEENEVYQTLIFTDEEGEKGYKEYFPDLQIVRWHPFSCDILPKEGSKARGIQKLLEHANLELENIYVFGDGLNDVEMLTFVPNSIAMGNGHPKAKGAAKYITDHVDEDGIYNVCRKLQLI
jgi:Cof subfamily protein (haloacid dehalogenase superfamily)